MKSVRILALLLCCLILPIGACASTADASIVAPRTVKLTAPYAGVLLPFDAIAGDAVSAGQTLFALDTTPVYAAQAGRVSAVFAKAGDDAQGVLDRYGSLAVLEPLYPRYIDADTKNAHDDDDSKWLHAGETLYLKYNSEKGTGRVMWVDGENYAVEILTGNFNLGNSVRCYRESAMPSDSETGRGRVRRLPDIQVAASGRIAAVHVSPGDTVAVGDLLFETIDAQSAPGVSSEVSSPVDGAILSLAVASGSPVARGQLLCEIADLSRLELSCELDELDYASVHVGDVLSYTLDAYPGRTFSGQVTAIRPLAQKRVNASYFDVRITLPSDVILLPGMNGTVTLNK